MLLDTTSRRCETGSTLADAWVRPMPPTPTVDLGEGVLASELTTTAATGIVPPEMGLNRRAGPKFVRR